MSLQTQSVVPAIEWDDSVVFIFSWNNRQFFSGFVHMQIALSTAQGSQTQINSILQQIQQSQVQVSTDPQSWLEAIKNAARNNSKVSITFDDSTSVNYTTQTAQPFQLQILFSITG